MSGLRPKKRMLSGKDGNGSGSGRVEQYQIHSQIHEDILCLSKKDHGQEIMPICKPGEYP